MDIYVLNRNLTRIGLIDNYVSLIWTTRYYFCGDFELYLPITDEFLTLLQIGYYLETTNSKYVMLIESINIKTDAESGNYLTVSGRSVESLLDRRIVCDRFILQEAKIETICNSLIEWNFINPVTEHDSRFMGKIAIASQTKGFTDEITTQYFGDNVYEAITELCQSYGYGFKMPRINKNFTFEMYSGLNRTRSQKDNIPAVFSPNFENLINTEYSYSIQNLKNVAFVAGEGEGSSRKTTFAGDETGIERREMYVDARDLSSEKANSESEYISMLISRGENKLAATETYPQYVGEVNNFPDYCGLGDIVEVENEFGMRATARITEIIESYSTNGNTRVPTFDEWSV